MESKLYTKQQVIEFINAGNVMLLSGSANALKDLPKGKWIAGTTPYCMDNVGKCEEEMIFVDDFTQIAKQSKIEVYDKDTIKNIAINGYKNGVVFLVLPIETDVYYTFSDNSLSYEGIFDNPVVGYVACMKMEDYGKIKPETACGIDGKLTEDKAVALYIELPNDLAARAEIINLDTIDYDTSVIVFPKTGFIQSDCTIDGKPGNIAQYLENVIKPKVGNYSQLITSQNGALINRDVKVVDVNKGEVSFFSSAYAGDEYRMVKNGADYFKMFNETLADKRSEVAACFSCVSYFFGGNFLGKHVSKNGIYAFGEIAYQLLNKTIVTLEIDKVG